MATRASSNPPADSLCPEELEKNVGRPHSSLVGKRVIMDSMIRKILSDLPILWKDGRLVDTYEEESFSYSITG